MYYLTVGVKNSTDVIETVLGFPLQGGTPTSYPLLPIAAYDILAIDWSSSMGALVALVTDHPKNTYSVVYWSSSKNAWENIFSYPTNTVTVGELGQFFVTPDGDIAIISLESVDGKGWAFAISAVSLTAQKEISRVTVTDDLDLLADIVLCDV